MFTEIRERFEESVNPSSLLHCLPRILDLLRPAWNAAVQIHNSLADNGLTVSLQGFDMTSSQGQARPCYRPPRADGRWGAASRSRNAVAVPMQKPAHETSSVCESTAPSNQAEAAHDMSSCAQSA